VQGDFARGDMISCHDSQGREVARGLVNYSAVKALLIMGLPSSDIESTLGYWGDEELIRRNNLVLF
jgi:glutamate 5-kinase